MPAKKARTTDGLAKKAEAQKENRKYKKRRVRNENIGLELTTADKTFEDLTETEKDQLLKFLFIKAEFIKPS